jgi:hypothetical protein
VQIDRKSRIPQPGHEDAERQCALQDAENGTEKLKQGHHDGDPVRVIGVETPRLAARRLPDPPPDTTATVAIGPLSNASRQCSAGIRLEVTQPNGAIIVGGRSVTARRPGICRKLSR